VVIRRFDLFVPGRPVPQGSKTALVSKSTGRPIVVDKDVRLPQWRMTITAHALERKDKTPGLDFPMVGPIGARITFVLNRPKNHFGTGKNASLVKPGSPKYPATMPDIDKLLRAVLDGLTDAGVWVDDGQVVWVQTIKVYTDQTLGSRSEGVEVTLGLMP
jgi:Holliday junction resolvase RusA-like endonuclease